MLAAVLLGARGVCGGARATGSARSRSPASCASSCSACRAGAARSANRGPRALGRATRSNPRLYGGLVVHLGVVLIAVALAASSAYSTQHARCGCDAASRRPSPATRSRTSARDVDRVGAEDHGLGAGAHRAGRRDLGVYAPAISTFPNSTEGIGTPSVRTGLREDVYLTLVSSPSSAAAG